MMRKYAIMDGINVISITESDELDFKIEGQLVIDITDIEPQPHIGWTLWQGKWSPKPMFNILSGAIIHNFTDVIEKIEEPTDV